MKRYMLDTNTVSHSFKRHPLVMQRLQTIPIGSLCISCITEAELLFGVAKRPGATQLLTAVDSFLRHVHVLAWDSAAAKNYGPLRADLEQAGKTLAPLDMLIAAHARAVNATLVTNDQAFAQVPRLKIEDWTAA
jgi:tRNA(fMet)-specific endonuclease VapC